MNAPPFGPKHPSAVRASVFDGSPWRVVLFIVLGVGLYTGGVLSVSPRVVSEDAVKASLAEHFPDLKVTAINCRDQPGRCEVMAGELVFMTDYAGKTIFLGQRLEPRISTDDLVNRNMAEREWRAIPEAPIPQHHEKQ